MATVKFALPNLAHLRRNPTSIGSRYLAGVVWALGGSIVARSIAMLTSIVSARILPASSYGALGIIQSTVGMFGVVAGAGLGLTLTKYVSELRDKNPAKARHYYQCSLGIASVTSILIAAAFFMLGGWIARTILGQPSLTPELRIGAFIALFAAIGGVQLGMLTGAERFDAVNVSIIAKSIITFIGIAFGAAYWGLAGAVTALVAAEALCVVLNHFYIRATWARYRPDRQAPPITISDFKQVMAFSIPALLSSLSTQPAIWLSSSLVVRQPGGLDAIAYFTAADRWRQLLLFLPSALSTNTLPLLSNLSGRENRSGFNHVLKLNVLLNSVAIVIPVLVTVLASHTLMALFGRQYVGSSLTLSTLAVAAIFMVANNVLGQVVVSKGLIWARLLLDIVLGCFLLATAVLLVPGHLDLGLAVAYLIAYAVTSVLLGGLVLFLLFGHPKSLLPKRAAHAS